MLNAYVVNSIICKLVLFSLTVVLFKSLLNASVTEVTNHDLQKINTALCFYLNATAMTKIFRCCVDNEI